MNELLGKLTNLSYEFFGVILPGVVLSFFLTLWLAALGPCVPVWTNGAVPQITILGTRNAVDAFGTHDLVGLTVPAVVSWYCLGHVLLWVARSGGTDSHRSALLRIASCLRFRVPKPKNSFHPNLQKLFGAVREDFKIEAGEHAWREFYPVAKNYIAQKTTYSLVSTYQNKYTLHRSIVAASAVLFWMSLAGIVLASLIPGSVPHWNGLLLLVGGALVLVWKFCDSYLYHWEMFGNTIVTEAYSLLHGPKP